MSRKMTPPRLLLFLGMAILANGQAAALAQHQIPGRLNTDAPLTQSGWWVRVEASDRDLKAMKFEFGTVPMNAEVQGTWPMQGSAAFALPASLQPNNILYVRAASVPADKLATVCVFFNTEGVARLKLTGIVQQLNVTDRDADCAL